MRQTNQPLQAVRIWDAPVRLFHWLLVALVVAAYVIGQLGIEMRPWHMRLGYAIVALLGFRLTWGFVGGRTSRFRAFCYHPSSAWRHARQLLAGREPPAVGHNPLGGYMVFLLLLLLLMQVVTGLCASDDILYQGPLHHLLPARWGRLLSQWHSWQVNVLLGAVAVHVVAIVVYWIRGENLIKPMLTGYKRLPQGTPESPLLLWRGLALLALWLLVVFVLLT
jgi:cytochrome b